MPRLLPQPIAERINRIVRIDRVVARIVEWLVRDTGARRRGADPPDSGAGSDDDESTPARSTRCSMCATVAGWMSPPGTFAIAPLRFCGGWKPVSGCV